MKNPKQSVAVHVPVESNDSALKIDAKLFRTIIDNIPVCVYVKDKNYKKILVNAYELNQFGWKAETEVLGKTDAEIFGQDVGKNTLKEDQTVLVDGKAIFGAEKMLKNGEWALVSKLPLKNENDEVIGLLGISVNITEKVMNEQKLQISYDRLNELSAQSRSFAWEIDKSGLFTFMSPNVEIVLGYNSETLTNKRYFYDILSLDVRDSIVNDAFKLMSNREVINNYEKKSIKSDGSVVWLSTNCKPMYDLSGEFVGYRGIDTDISSRKLLLENIENARKVAEESSKAKEIFLTNMSHEIRTPLNVIIGMIREIGKDSLTENQSNYLRYTETAAYHLLSIVNNVLDMSKIESGEFALDIKDFSLSAVLSNVKSMLSSKALAKGIDFSIEVNGELSRVLRSDSLKLSQALINLLGNSIKFTDNGFVNLKLTAGHVVDSTQYIVFEIIDTGIGMSEEYQQRMFSKFTQEYDSSNRSYEGTGLGLSITKEIVELMGGKLDIKSKKGEGTNIRFELNLPIGDEDKLVEIQSVHSSTELTGIKVLVVEDNEMNRFIACQTLKEAKCDIEVAENGFIAIEKMRLTKFDVVLMDIQMPMMDGVEATKIIRQRLQMDTPIIALTANAFKHDIDSYLSLGMNDYLIKPYTEHELLAKIEQLLRMHKGVRNIDTIDKLLKKTDCAFSLDQLNVIARGNKDMVKSMLILFLKMSVETVYGLEEAYSRLDYETINHLAHKIKPSLDTMEVKELHEDIRFLESYKSDTSDIKLLGMGIERVTSLLNLINKQLEPIK